MLDAKDWAILEAVQEDARLSYAELGRRADLSPPSAAERLRRLEDQGIITGYHAAVDVSKLGKALPVLIRMSVSNKEYSRFRGFIQNEEEITECDHVSGSDALFIRAAVESVQGLEALIQRLSDFGQTTTSLILSRFLSRRVFRRPVSSK